MSKKTRLKVNSKIPPTISHMAKKISLINMKGGVGKSTLAVNLAWQYAAYLSWKKKVLIIDLDPQFNASQYLLGATKYQKILEENKHTIWDVFELNTSVPGKEKDNDLTAQSVIHNVIKFDSGGRIDLIPSRLELAYSMRNPSQKESLLKKFVIDKVEKDYDLILLDCAPTESVFTTAAYISSNFILVPVKPEFLSTVGLPLLASSLKAFKKGPYADNEINLAGIVFNQTTGNNPEETKAKGEVRQLANKNGWYVFNSEINYSRSYPRGSRDGKPIFWTSYARTKPAKEFNGFASELAQRIKL
jgi:chromosome partitioning protein